MANAMAGREMFVLGVALITWAGVFVYLLRLDALAKRLEKELRYREQERAPVDPQARAPIASAVENGE